jgi:predicted dehydrogenase
MLDAAESKGVCHAVCFEGRWSPGREGVRNLMKQNYLGKPYLVVGRSGGDYWHPTRKLQSEWMYQRASGGGYLQGMASHDIDFTCAIFGEPEAVCADVRTSVKERARPDGSTLAVDADDTAALLIRMQNGMIAHISTTAMALNNSIRSYQAYGSEASFTLEGTVMGDDQLKAGKVADKALLPIEPSGRMPRSGVELPKRRAAGAIRSLALMLEDWLPAFSGKPVDVPTLKDGHRVQRIMDAALKSSAGAGWVKL